MRKDIEKIKKQILPILERHDVKNVSIFGSFARGENKKDSDIDFLVAFKMRKSLFDMAGLKQDLEKELKRNVDVLTYNSIHPYIRENINKDALKIYG
ncbi:nucleotidyltransferase family protein [bacterium]|nr:nucleotidyltransferase family protein [bacterium]